MKTDEKLKQRWIEMDTDLSSSAMHLQVQLIMHKEGIPANATHVDFGRIYIQREAAGRLELRHCCRLQWREES
jgi:hypothetical protein